MACKQNRYLCFILLTALVWQLFISNTSAQTDRQLEREKSNNNTQKRVALVIGNGAYTKAKSLPNPPNDAADMAKALKDVGFEVFSGVNQNKRQIETLIRDFGAKLAASGGVGLFYYAGHGIQVGGENYLVPVDADIPEEDEVSYSAVPLSLVLTKMTTAKNELNIVILDACRNNPFARSWRTFRDNSNADGLAKISPPTGTLVLYATEPGKVASDGAGRNGLFTEALLKQINKPNLEYDQLVKAVSADVWQKSNKQQLPWKEGNSLQDFYFVPKDSPVVEAVKNNQTETTITAKTKTEQEREAWDLVKNSTDAEDFRYFLKEFPDGANAANAKIRLEETVWLAVKNSTDKAKIQTFLNDFPNGANAPAARIRLRQLESKTTNPSLITDKRSVDLVTANNSVFNGTLVSFENAAFTILIKGEEIKFQLSEIKEINFKNSGELRRDIFKLKDGSIVAGTLVKYYENKITVIVGTGSRQRQMSFYLDEIESITLGESQTTANTDNSEKTIEDTSKWIKLNVKVLPDNATSGWTNTGWVVKKGQKIRISCEGNISLGNGRFSGPNGISSLPDKNKLIQSEATGGLIAVIGDDNNDFIFIGASREFVAIHNGALFLGVNEGNLDDNSGAFNATVEIQSN